MGASVQVRLGEAFYRYSRRGAARSGEATNSQDGEGGYWPGAAVVAHRVAVELRLSKASLFIQVCVSQVALTPGFAHAGVVQ